MQGRVRITTLMMLRTNTPDSTMPDPQSERLCQLENRNMLLNPGRIGLRRIMWPRNHCQRCRTHGRTAPANNGMAADCSSFTRAIYGDSEGESPGVSGNTTWFLCLGYMNQADIKKFSSWLGKRSYRARVERLGIAVDTRRIATLRKSGASWATICQETGLSKGTAQRALHSLPKNHFRAVSTTDVDSFVRNPTTQPRI